MSARKRIRAALKARVKDGDTCAYAGYPIQVSDIEQVLEENQHLRIERREALQKVHHLLRERSSLNTQMAEPEEAMDLGVRLAVDQLINDQLPPKERTWNTEADLVELNKRIKTWRTHSQKHQEQRTEFAHAISERNAYRSALQACASAASGMKEGNVFPTPDKLQEVVCQELSRLKSIEEQIRGILA